MDRNKSQYARLIELDGLIRQGRYPNCLTFAEEWGVSSKTVQRDIDFLRDQMGAPIEYDRERKGYRYTNDSWMLPSLMLTEGELWAVLMAARGMEQYSGTPVAAHLARVFQKIADSLPDKVSLRPELLYSQFSFRGPPAKTIDANIWAAVVKALTGNRVLKVVYRPFETPRRKDKTSRICPWHIANLHGEWYVFGVHEGYDDVRQFAIPRIERAVVTKTRFDVPRDFKPESVIDAAFARYAGDGSSRNIRLLFNKQVAEWITERQWHPRQSLKRRRNGDIELAFPAAGLYEVQRWVLSWGRWVRVLAPETLIRDVDAEIKAMTAIVKETK